MKIQHVVPLVALGALGLLLLSDPAAIVVADRSLST